MEHSKYSRFYSIMNRAKAGEEITIGFIGGSITEGSVASSPARCYAYRVYEWWQRSFPQATFRYINAGIGGTTSHFGVARVEEDLLQERPDVVFIDFCVNDDSDPSFFKETIEGLVRKVLWSQGHPAVMLLNNILYNTGVNAEPEYLEIMEHYQLPGVSVRDTIYSRIQRGELRQEDVTPDALHPNDYGHGLLADELIHMLEEACAELDEVVSSEGADVDSIAIADDENGLPDPVTKNTYQHARRLDNRGVSPVLQGFEQDEREKLYYLDHFKRGWKGRRVGDAIRFEIEAQNIAIQYRKTIHRPAPVAQLILDGDTEHPVILDANFDEDWGDCLYLKRVLHHGTYARHTVDIAIIEAPENIQAEFYLMSLITA